jgi:MFS family permease
MQQVFLGALLLISTPSLFLLIGALFPQLTDKTREVIEKSQGRTFLIGFVNLLFLAAILFISIFLVERVSLPPIFSILGLAAVAAFAIGTLVGLTSITHLIGERILPEHTQPQRNIRAAIILILALLTPIIGWYLFFPYTAILGFGGLVAAMFQKWRQHKNSGESKEAKE